MSAATVAPATLTDHALSFGGIPAGIVAGAYIHPAALLIVSGVMFSASLARQVRRDRRAGR